jgi:transcriptional regulator with XRE-family HTH domain
MRRTNTPPPADDEAERRQLGEKLREARKYVGLSQEEAAAILKLPRTAVTDIESGHRKVKALELKRMAELYRQPVSHFTGEDARAEPLSADVVHLARQVASLSAKDRKELERFAEFLRGRSTTERRRG